MTIHENRINIRFMGILALDATPVITCFRLGKENENILVIGGRGTREEMYSVDEASARLGIPRPTLYRYLREYSVPHTKRSGRISIPESSVERLRRVRDLHREGMGTGAVRRLLKEGSEEGGIRGRLEHISREIEGVRSGARHSSVEDLNSSQAIRTLLARQSLLMGAVLDLTDMVEELMRANGHTVRRGRVGDLRESPAGATARKKSVPLDLPVPAFGTATEAPPASVTYLTPRGGVHLRERSAGASTLPRSEPTHPGRPTPPEGAGSYLSFAREEEPRPSGRRAAPTIRLAPSRGHRAALREKHYGHLSRRRRAVGRLLTGLALAAVVVLALVLLRLGGVF